EISAGGVIYRIRRGRPDVCLIATQGGRAWQLPKGLIERGEPPEEAARREVAEETGLQGKLLQRLDRIEYWYFWTEDGERVRVHKFVYFFLFRYARGSTRDHDEEVDDARWVPLSEAETRLSFENERRVVRLAAEVIETAA
ncbi:MAG: NUDIX hydrolase, partial [Dehalococcoidia bacterium]|nr:NUDIX hydrolase [Dehalococcoidia bacterium]